ncbi:hypothetical protein [Flavobacterium sp. SORGH_AS_0622]|uniref:hypothetical protein n=1 Tax=Flavobacterium sp. SORGH_AS_0622 TaxID=3041772 RepID=UPI00277D859B|nr:hypothetical protein [Flavobacterium sp. SORGH_AS_0622]MDQ1165912.1 hypothetical protein [Flavobacterium sp. SORGH_AS_0622]
MQQVVTEIYIAPFSGSTDYVKLDLFNNESINLKYTQKDLTDLSKVFAPYSLSFTIPATPKNRQALLFFGDTDVQKANITGSFPCKIYTDGNLNLTGNFTVEDAKYDLNGMTNIQGSFETDFKSLKERIGDDLITDLGSVLTGSTSLQYSPTVAKNSIESKQLLLKELGTTSVGTTSRNDITINYITPLASTNRVWSYDTTSDVIDNVAYSTSFSGVTNQTAILTEELRPAISYRALVEMMFKKYDLKVNLPLRNDKLFNEMYVWVNGATSDEKLSNDNVLKFGSTFNTAYPQTFSGNIFGVQYPLVPDKYEGSIDFDGALPRKYTTSYYTRNDYDIIKVNIGDRATQTLPGFDAMLRTSKSIRINVRLKNLISQTPNGKITISLRKPSGNTLPADCEEILKSTIDFNTQENNIFIDVPDTVFDNYTVDFSLYPTFEAYILFKTDLAVWEVTDIFTQYIYFAPYTGGMFDVYEVVAQRAVSNGSERDKSSGTLDVIQSLPKIKVVDFFQSFLKTFNLSIYNPIVNTNELQILNVEDINEVDKIYGKKEVDYTPFVNAKSFTKSVQDKYTKYNFKHATSKYKSNVDYVAGNTASLEYGQVTQDNGAVKKSEYSVITNYTIIPPRGVVNTNLVTYYGFSNELEEQENRYKPINNELVLFVNNELAFLNAGVQLGYLLTDTTVVPLNRYMLMLPWLVNAKQSLGFSVLVDDVTGNLTYKEKTSSLYERFYSSQTIRLLNVNVLSHKFDLFLPSSEIYVNPTRTNEPPTGFRLQNDIIIGETRFSVLDANIDITTGKTKLTLLNYVTLDDTDKEVIPTPNQYSPEGYDSTQYQIQ